MKALMSGMACGLAVAAMGLPAMAQDMSMSFFVTSQNPGDGGNLGGLDGADAQCQKLAAAVGAGGKTWHAYLSTSIGQCPRPHRQGPLVQRQGRVDRRKRR